MHTVAVVEIVPNGIVVYYESRRACLLDVLKLKV